MELVRERSTYYLTTTFRDKAGAPVSPSTVSYRVDCLTTGTAIRGDTSVTPASSVEIALTPSDTTIVNVLNAREVRRVTVKATYGASDGINDQFDLAVQNMSFVP